MATPNADDTNKYPEVYTFFWQKESPFSQWHPSKFVADDILYNCAEQYMMHQKACKIYDINYDIKINIKLL